MSTLRLLVVTLAVLTAACGVQPDSRPPVTDGRLRVVATTTILGDLASRIVGQDGAVEVLMQPGQDPHAFSPSAKQAAAIRDADLVVASGLGLEETLTDLLASAEEDGVEVLRVAERLAPIEYGRGDEEDEHADEGDEHTDEGDEHTDEGDEHTETDGGSEAHHVDDGHGHGPLDPHVHLDPVRMAEAAMLVAQAIEHVTGSPERGTWTQRGDALAAEILAAHDEAAARLASVPEACRTIVTNHESLHYFARRYGFVVAGAVIPGGSTQAEPSAKDFAALVETIRETGVPAIVAETTQSTRLAETLAGEVGRDITIVELYTDSLGEPGSGADTYIGLVRTNAERLADALADC